MNLNQTIKAHVELPCSIRYWAEGLRTARAITKELSRESLVVITLSAVPVERLSFLTHIAVGIELPHSREFQPRVLECAATVSAVRQLDSGLRISAKVNRMTIKDREPEQAASLRFDAGVHGLRPFAAVAGPRNSHSVVLRSHLTEDQIFNLQDPTQTQGENSMSFIKKLFVEEDGQDMVEYGLVIALVVLGSAALLTAFSGSISTGFSTLGSSVDKSL